MPRGFQNLTSEQRREIAGKGGRAAHRTTTLRHGATIIAGHEWSSAEAREAGRKGGLANAGRPRYRAGCAECAAHKAASRKSEETQ